MHISETRLDDLIMFHGHFCPGLATGVRVAEIGLEHLGERAPDEELVAVAECANCAVDAIQFLMGCTYGKGNLIHLDYGRNVYTLARRSEGQALRLTLKPSPGHALSSEDQVLVERVRAKQANAQERNAYDRLWQARGRAVLEIPAEELFEIELLDNYVLPSRAVIEPSQRCTQCNALVMRSRLTAWRDQRLCARCLDAVAGDRVPVAIIGTVENELIAGQAPSRARSPQSRITLYPAYHEGLLGLVVGQYVQVLFYFDRAPHDPPMQQHPRGDQDVPKRGVFALRSPHRPSSIGLTTVEILAVDQDSLVVSGLDAWNGTRVLDVKPYVGSLDDK